MNEETKPSILLSLPPELWHQIMRTTEDDEDSYVTLRHAALAHRILQPYAQEELLRNVNIYSKDLPRLVRSLQGSKRLAEYAKRTEYIYLMGNQKEEGGMNELQTTLFEMCYNVKGVKVLEHHLRLSSITQLTKLRYWKVDTSKICIDTPTASLPRLEQLDIFQTHFVDKNGNGPGLDLVRSFFSPAQLLALQLISIDDVALEEDPTRFNLLLPQLSDIEFCFIPSSVVATQLPHCTSPKTLRLNILSDDEPTASMPILKSLRDLNLVDFLYCDHREDDREASLRNIRSIMAIVGEMTNLKQLSLVIAGINEDSESMMKWREFKGEVRKICQKNKVKVIRSNDDDETLERHELTWVD